jgi:hypothetical protein
MPTNTALSDKRYAVYLYLMEQYSLHYLARTLVQRLNIEELNEYLREQLESK